MSGKRNYPFKTRVMLDFDLMSSMMKNGTAVDDPVHEDKKRYIQNAWKVGGEVMIDGAMNKYEFTVFKYRETQQVVLYFFDLERK